MNVTELGYETLVVSHIVIEIPGLPEWGIALGAKAALPRQDSYFGLEELHGLRKHSSGRLTHEQVNVFRHDDIGKDMHPESSPGLL